jgi:ankyrin repeat domain-containing protein 17
MEVIRLLVARGAAPSEIFAAAYLNDLDRVVALLEADPERVHDRDDAGMTPLHRAAENGQAEVVEALLAQGADVEAQTDEGQTPLQRSCYRSGVVDLLLAHGASMDVFTAINLEKTACVARLLGREPCLVRAKMWDQTPLQIAARRDNAGLVRLLLDHGADVDANGGWKGWTPLHWAAYDGRAEIVTLLLASAADVHARDQDGKPPAAIAAERGYGEIARLLRQHDAGA